MLQDTLMSALPAAMLFVLVTSITPGPNNMMLLASGINFGLRRTMPHMVGISLGVSVMMLGVGFGLGKMFTRFPILYPLLEAGSVVYLLYLAWKIGTSGQIETRKGTSRPMRCYEGMAFQLINPKAWMMVLTAATTLHLSNDVDINARYMALVFCLIGFPCIFLWAAFGTAMRRVLSRPSWVRTFNIVMALALVVTLYPVVLKLLA
ncbi:lysine transporter LysE [Robbsia andropogonis]|uniref:Lysine transporter LysE n=2 Tax=Robbsia andropogonis TaxID=28092 RepID=A0A0F5K5X4_9BURK|nr:lysine transporter LysE [Robbsia andropogonis]